MPTFSFLGKDKVIQHKPPFLLKFEGRIKCIYIDPPYNTGNEGWIYNDNVNDPHLQKWIGEVVGREGEDLTRHDKWLCMMYPRLRLLQRLLADDGAIFISIDDNELYSLKFVCDEIFGANNFVANLVWEKKKKGAFLSKTLTNVKEYILVYCKSIGKFSGLIGEINRATETYPCINPTNPRSVRIIPKGTPSKYKERNYRIEANTKVSAGNMNLIYLDAAIIENGILQTDVKIESNWRYQQSMIDEFAKPSRLIGKLIQSLTEKDSIVLDSFAGSGTTAHAVINLNKADGGSRRFILIELNDYAETITSERVRRIGGEFNFYELGKNLFEGDFINPKIPLEQLREYIYFMETRKSLPPATDEKFLLGVDNGIAYYYCHEQTMLNFEFLSTRADYYVIYADACNLSDEQLATRNITFKQIPYDVPKY